MSHVPKNLLALVFAVIPSALVAQTAPDATGVGPFGVVSSEYKLPAAIDPIVLADAPADLPLRRIPTELWARVYRPDPMPAGALPLLVFLHGNHATCGRLAGAGQGRFDINIHTFIGTCPVSSLSPIMMGMRMWPSDWPLTAILWFRSTPIAA